jgi:hypothetical protein
VFRVPEDMHLRLMRGEQPTVYVGIVTGMGRRVYGMKKMTNAPYCICNQARLIDAGTMERTIEPGGNNALIAFQGGKIQQHISVQLDNADKHFSELLAIEPMMYRPMTMYVGFDDDAYTYHITLFSGRIIELSVLPIMTVEAAEA